MTKRKQRSGAILVATLICMLVATALAVSSLAATRLLYLDQNRAVLSHQSEWLLKAAMLRAETLLKSNSKFDGEVWELPDSVTHCGTAVIRTVVEPVESIEESPTRTVTINLTIGQPPGPNFVQRELQYQITSDLSGANQP